MSRIKLGDKVRDKITGLEGIAVCKIIFINGCVQYSVQPKWDKKTGTIPEDANIDEKSLEVISPKIKKIKDDDDGGRMTFGTKMRGY